MNESPCFPVEGEQGEKSLNNSYTILVSSFGGSIGYNKVTAKGSPIAILCIYPACHLIFAVSQMRYSAFCEGAEFCSRR